MVVFSVVDTSSFQYAVKKIEIIRDKMKCSCPIILVGNKCDLARNRSVSGKGTQSRLFHLEFYLQAIIYLRVQNLCLSKSSDFIPFVAKGIIFLTNFLIDLFYVDAQKIADKFRCKYIETSVVLNHNIDELLVGVVRKVIQRREGGKKQTTTEDYQSSKSPSFTRRMLNKLKKFGQSKDKSTNLYD